LIEGLGKIDEARVRILIKIKFAGINILFLLLIFNVTLSRLFCLDESFFDCASEVDQQSKQKMTK
jgi:hypothetical protein